MCLVNTKRPIYLVYRACAFTTLYLPCCLNIVYNVLMVVSRNLNGWYKLRWQVLARDLYTCQYCGQSAPNVQLEVDHKVAVADGGTGDLGNLVTACWACNRGKSGLRQSIALKVASDAELQDGKRYARYRQEAVLGLLRDHPGLTTTDVMNHCDITMQNATMVLGRLRNAGRIVKKDRLWFMASA